MAMTGIVRVELLRGILRLNNFHKERGWTKASV